MRPFAIISFLLLALSDPEFAVAQLANSLPEIVRRQIDDQTFAVVKVNLNDPTILTIDSDLRPLWNMYGSRTQQEPKLEPIVKLLASAGAKEVYLSACIGDWSLDQITLIIPSQGKKESDVIASLLKTIVRSPALQQADGVVVCGVTENSRPRKITPVDRPDLANAFNDVGDFPIQVAVALGNDARRVLREFPLPLYPDAQDPQSAHLLADGWKWIAVGIATIPERRFAFHVQAQDPAVAESLKQIVAGGVKMLLNSPFCINAGLNRDGLLSLLTPVQHQDRLTISIDKTRDGMKQLQELLTPILVEMENIARQRQSKNNLKQLILGLHYYHDKHGRFPSQASQAAGGRKLLSWRVMILPFLNENALYNEFRLDEPWDSPHNSKLIPRMPATFVSSAISREQQNRGLTGYLGVAGEKSLFANPEGTTIKDITDGTSNTIALIEVGPSKAVPWTQPEDLNLDPKQFLESLKDVMPKTFIVAMCDGSVRTISTGIPAETLRRLFQINDGEIVGEF